MRKRAAAFGILVAAIGLMGCDELLNPQPQITGGGNTGTMDQIQAEAYNGPKARIAVLDFENKAGASYGALGNGMSDMLATELLNTNRYIVLERQKLAGVLAEQDLARMGRIQPGTGAATGQVEGAELLVTGAITAFEPDYQGGGIGIGGGSISRHGRHGDFGGIGLGVKQSYVALDLRVIDTRTSRIVAATTVTGKTSDFGIGVGGGGWGRHSMMGGSLGVFKNTPMEKAVRQCLAAAIAFVVSRTPANYYHFDETGQPITPGTTGGGMMGVTPTVVQPTVVQPITVPAQPAQPTPVQPAPIEPTPVQPTPAQPVEPTPVQPPPPPPPPPPAAAVTVYVAFATVNLYEKPDANSQMVASAAKGAALRVDKQEGSWYQVTAPDGKSGWVLKAFTSPTAPE